MTAALIHGSTGTVAFTDAGAGTIHEDLGGQVFAFTLNLVNDEFDNTMFATTGEGRSAYMGMYTGRGSCQAFMDKVTMVPETDWAAGRSFAAGVHTVTLTLTASTGRTYAFLAAANNFGFAVDKQTGLNALTFDFTSQGTITFA